MVCVGIMGKDKKRIEAIEAVGEAESLQHNAWTLMASIVPEKLPKIALCSACGATPKLETGKPIGRRSDLHRVICACGHTSPQWSVSPPAAIRFWNRFAS